MRMNRRMQEHLRELQSREIELALDPGFAARAQLNVEEVEELVLLVRPAGAWRSRLAAFDDRTNLECTANKLSVGDLLDPRLTASCPLLLLTAGLVLAERLPRELAAVTSQLQASDTAPASRPPQRFSHRHGQRANVFGGGVPPGGRAERSWHLLHQSSASLQGRLTQRVHLQS